MLQLRVCKSGEYSDNWREKTGYGGITNWREQGDIIQIILTYVMWWEIRYTYLVIFSCTRGSQLLLVIDSRLVIRKGIRDKKGQHYNSF